MTLIPVLAFGFLSCANQTAPTGGPKDADPPKLLASGPVHGAVNYRAKQVTLLFDEAVRIENAKEQVMISPSVGKDFTLIARKNQAILTFEQPLADSTTYSIRFRESIKDITEGNPAQNIELAFSTGPYLDSLFITGTVKDLLSATAMKDVTVAIFLQDTFDVFRHSPSWFSKTDASGAYALRNLRPGRYHLYAFDDKNKNLRIESRGEKYGIHPVPLFLTDSIAPVELTVLALDARPLRLITNRPDEQSATFTFSKPLYQANLRDMTGHKVPIQFEDSYSRIRAYVPDLFPDSLLISLKVTDSIAQSLDTLIYIKTRPQRVLREPFKPVVSDSRLLTESVRFTATINFNKPLRELQPDSIYCQLDSTYRIQLSSSDFTYDTLALTLHLSKILDKTALSILNTTSKTRRPSIRTLFLAKGAFRSVLGDSSVQATQKISVTPPQDLGTLLVTVQTGHASFEVQLIQARTGIPVQSIRNQKTLTFRNIEPGEYYIRALIDLDTDGIWEWGNPIHREAPEPVRYYTAQDGSQSIVLRANWELGPLMLKF
jgi:uncharacterized protein (DUF2141 family)